MKYFLVIAALFIAPPALGAEQESSVRLADQRKAITLLNWMDGEWRGEAVIVTPTGKHLVTQTERVGSMLDGTVKVIEGLGLGKDGKPEFNALAIISYDSDSKSYAFRSYAQGHSGTFPVVATAGEYIWEVPAGPQATIRYRARQENGQWIETGDFLVEGQPPRRVFEMALRRKGDTEWPAARSVP